MRAFVLVTIVVATHLACGGKAGPEPLRPRTLELTAENACRESAKALCKRAIECSKPLVDFFFGSPELCETDVLSTCALRYEGPGASKTPASCTDIANALTCDVIKDMALYLAEPGADLLLRYCPVTPGAFADNDNCLSHGDCQSTFCAHEPKRACGRCQAAPKEREACSAARECAAPLRCVGASRFCGSPRLPGEPCGLGCANGQCAPDGHCESPVGLYESCDHRICDLGIGLVCNEQNTRCEPLFIVGVGEPCDKLDLPLSPGMRFCAGSLGRNDCVKGVCTVINRYGRPSFIHEDVVEGCGSNADCKKGTCVNGHCRVACLP